MSDLTGIVVYASQYFFDKSDFMEQMSECLPNREENISIVIDNDIVYGNQNGELFLLARDALYCASNNNIPDFCVFRSNDWRLAEHLENMGIRCFPSSRNVRICSDKALCLSQYCGAVNMPDTIYYKGLMTFNEDMFPMMVKAVEGHSGDYVYKVYNNLELDNYERIIGLEKNMIFQQACLTGDDLRVYILGNEILAAIIRICAEGEYKANLQNGSTARDYPLNDEQRKIIQKVIDVTPEERGFICIDFLFDKEGKMVFNEMNAVPGIKRLSELKDINFANLYLDYVVARCQGKQIVIPNFAPKIEEAFEDVGVTLYDVSEDIATSGAVEHLKGIFNTDDEKAHR